MFDEKYINEIKEELKHLEEVRDKIIELSIKVTRISKSIIYSLISGKGWNIESLRKEMKEKVNELRNLINQYFFFYNDGSIGMQEYVEAELLYNYLNNRNISSHEELGVDIFIYLYGLTDFVGELIRLSNKYIMEGDIKKVEEIKKHLEDLYLKLLSLEPKKYDLRRRIDGVAKAIEILEEKITRFYTK